MMQPETATSFRLSPQQERLWSAEEPTGRSRGAFVLSGPLDAARLREALLQVVERHEILRTTFQRQSGMRLPLQVVQKELSPEWEAHDLSGLASELQEAESSRLIADQQSREWDLQTGPLLRALVLSYAPGRHLLVLSVASACADAAAVATIARELAAHYAGEPAAPEPLQYADFAEWQHELLASGEDEAAAGKEFWAHQPDWAPPAVPFLREPAAAGVREFIEPSVDGSTLRAIQESAERYGVSDAVLVQAAWQVVLARLTGSEEFTLARLSRERRHSELETAVGAFARPLPVRAAVSSGSTFAEVAVHAGHAEAQAARWQDYAPAAAADGLPVAFSSMEPHEAVVAGELTVSVQTLAGDEARAPLELEWTRREGGPTVRLWFDPEAFDRPQADRLGAYVARVLAQAAARPEVEVGEIELLDGDDARRLTVAVNATAETFRSIPVHQLFAEASARAPQEVAVADGIGSITFAELDARTNQLAHRLQRAGAGPDVVVGLCTDRSIDMVVGVLGILKAGAAYLPLNFEHPPARLDHQLSETGAPVLVTQEGVLGRLPAFAGEVICLDRDRASLDSESADAPRSAVSPENLAYVVYTSGSTGLPKGVAVTHANLANYVEAIVSRLGADEERLAFGMVTAISTDLGNTAVFPALATGGTLVLVPPAVAAEGAALAAFMRAQPIDVLKITPSHLNALLAGVEAASVLPGRWLVTGGETLSWDIAARVRELGECRLLNHYGPTETTVGSCTFPVEDGPGPYAPSTVPIGTPIANTSCYVLDDRGRPVPEGVVGELFIGGAGVARGYVGQPEATGERFRPDPFAATTGARMYATGDLARRLPDGTIEFLGRSDDQLKIRGFRVEPAEVEAALRRVEAVQDVVVVARAEGQGERRLVAYVVAGGIVTLEELRRRTAEWVPEFMVPSAFVQLESFPRTPSGKVDRIALPAPEDVDAGGREYVPPRTPTEEAVAAIWADVLRLDRVGVEDDFFAIGGHSLLATQIVAQVRSDFSINLPLHALFSSPTVAALSQQIVEMIGAGADAETKELLAQLEGLSDEEAQRLLAGDDDRRTAV
jgi:amino acid adenylation domain-containing protein